MKKVILVILSLILFLIVATAIYILTFNINSYKGQIEDKLSEALNRKVSIRGTIAMNKSLQPRVSISDVDIESSGEFSHPSLMKIKQINLSLNLVPLFQKRLEISSVDLTDVELFLEVNKNGEKNWTSTSEGKETAAPSAAPKPNRPMPIRPQTTVEANKEVVILVERIDIFKLNASYEDAQKNTNEKIYFNNLSLMKLANFDGSGEYRGEKFSVKGTIQDLLNVVKTQKNFRLSFDLDIQGAQAKASAIIPDLNSLDSMTINVQAAGSNLRKTLSPFVPEASVIPNVPYGIQAAWRVDPNQRIIDGTLNLKKDAFVGSFSAEIKDDFQQADGRLSLELKDADLAKVYGMKPASFVSLLSLKDKKLTFKDFALFSGETDIDGTLSFDFSKEALDISGSVNSRFLKLPDLIISGTTGKDSGTAQKQKTTGSKLFSDENIDFPFLDRFTAQLNVNISNLYIGNFLTDYPRVLSTISLKDKKLTVWLNEGSSLAGAPVVGNLRISKGTTPQVSLFLIAEKAQINQLNKLSSHVKDGTLDLNVNLSTTGSSLKEMASNLNGKFLLIAKESTVISPILDSLQALSKLENKGISSRKGYALGSGLFLKTAVFNLVAKNGIVDLNRKVAIETNQLNIVLDGTIDLGTEKLDIEIIPSFIRNKATDIAQIVSKMIQVQGTILDPKIKSVPLRLVNEIASTALSAVNGETQKKTEDASPAKKAMLGTKFQTIDDYFGRNIPKPLIAPKDEEKEKVKEEDKRTEGQKRMEQFSKDLFDSFSDVLQSTPEEEAADKKTTTKERVK